MSQRRRRACPTGHFLDSLEPRCHLSLTTTAGFTIGRDSSEVTSLAADRAGNVYAAGTFQGVADFNPARNRSTTLDAADGAAFLARYSSAGRLAWVQRVPDTASVNALTTDRAGNLYVVGQLFDTTDFNLGPARHYKLTPRGTYDGFVAKYDPAGGLLWVSTYGSGNDFDSTTAIAIDGLGYVHATGATSDGSPGSNVFLATYSARGKFLRDAVFGDTFNMNAPAGLAADRPATSTSRA